MTVVLYEKRERQDYYAYLLTIYADIRLHPIFHILLGTISMILEPIFYHFFFAFGTFYQKLTSHRYYNMLLERAKLAGWYPAYHQHEDVNQNQLHRIGSDRDFLVTRSSECSKCGVKYFDRRHQQIDT